MVAVRSRFPTSSNKSTKTNFSVTSKKSVHPHKPTEQNLSDEQSKELEKTQVQNLAQVISLPQSKPLWLKSLMATQFTSSIVTVLLASASVAFYGLTIYGQSKWTTEYQQLQKLREEEQEISVANELLKNHIAEQASTSDSGLASRDSVKRIFLEPAPPRPAPNPPQPYLESTSGHKYLFKTPVGY
ncbi:hypothetical protein ACP6PL_06490 [Dapis sp. BLCC M126]|uniref:hypothetical protein n=1 Tax=Dapis sp. BLCC M126 TaxID=3400189 RepID=UPI003CECDDD6